jgi:rod shape-determining protein MreC
MFIALEVISIIMLVQNNRYHSASYAGKAKAVSGSIYAGVNEFKQYLSLKEANKALAHENAMLRNYLQSNYGTFDTTRIVIKDSLFKQQYRYQDAKVVNNTVNKQYNYITLNKGRKNGIKPDMAVIGPGGIVGLVNGVSENFANVMPLLNVDFRVSARLKKNNYLGSVLWEGKNFEYCTLKDIPQHVQVNIGDTVVTTGYTGSFPEGIMIGTVANAKLKDGNFLNIEVKISTVFKTLSYVSVIEDLTKEEVTTLKIETEK